MKSRKIITFFIVLSMMLAIVAACGTTDSTTAPATEAPEQTTTEAPKLTVGANTNNGRPYNLDPVKWDKRADKYLTGINATILPITEDEIVVDYWTSFESTIMQGLDESEVYQEMEKRTGVKINFIYPPVGQAADNFNLRVSSNDLPHVFKFPPAYPGGYQKGAIDGVYLELTDYYDAGMMPNYQWLRENNEQIYRDTIDDEGRIYFFSMFDIVPASPWTGLWVRADWLEELGLPYPTTIDDWDVMLRAMRDTYDIAPLAIDLNRWYGVRSNHMFVGSYEASWEFFHVNGEARYGPIEDGYLSFLTKMNEWYEDGLIDPDFATRDVASYEANIANGNVGAAGIAYGSLGQLLLTGALEAPDFSLKPVLQPTSYDGQVIHITQNDSTVRGPAEFITTRAVEDGIDEIIVRWIDYWYSQDGGDLCSYGPEGVSYIWDDQGEYEWIYPRLFDDDELDFWTIFPLFKIHVGGFLRNSQAYEMVDEVFECIELWATQDGSWEMPANISHTTDESQELTNIMVDVNTYRDEMSPKFIMGQEPLTNFDAFVTTIRSMNIDRAIEIKTDALERYFKR